MTVRGDVIGREPWQVSLRLSVRDVRALAAGQVSRWLRASATRTLVWYDQGPAAGVRAVQRRVRRRRRRNAKGGS